MTQGSHIVIQGQSQEFHLGCALFGIFFFCYLGDLLFTNFDIFIYIKFFFRIKLRVGTPQNPYIYIYILILGWALVI